VVMSEGRIVHEADAATAERHVLGAHMGGGHHAPTAAASTSAPVAAAAMPEVAAPRPVEEAAA